jgi:transcriptional regulator with XRE-family HTH domain
MAKGTIFTLMNYQTMTNAAIAAELGNRLERLRLLRNVTQQQMADEIGVTPKSYRQLVAGGGKVENLIAALRVLDALDQLDHFLPEPAPSPLQQLKLKGKERQRARTKTYAPSVRPGLGGISEEELDW